MAEAKRGDTVKVDYTGKLEDGTIFDSSDSESCGCGCEPLEFAIGEGALIPGFEEAVVGMAPGQSKTITITSDQAYGPYRDELVAVVDRSELPPNLNLQVGMELQVDQGEGEAFSVIVTDLNDQQVTLDANHPLAGRDLTFDIKLLDIA